MTVSFTTWRRSTTRSVRMCSLRPASPTADKSPSRDRPLLVSGGQGMVERAQLHAEEHEPQDNLRASATGAQRVRSTSVHLAATSAMGGTLAKCAAKA